MGVILAIVVCAVIAGARSFIAIASGSLTTHPRSEANSGSGPTMNFQRLAKMCR